MITRGNKYKKEIEPSTRAMLIRKGNEFFSQGNIEAAKRIYITCDYKDGLVRLGDYYFGKGDVYQSCQMYFISGNESKIKLFSQKCADMVRSVLNDQ